MTESHRSCHGYNTPWFVRDVNVVFSAMATKLLSYNYITRWQHTLDYDIAGYVRNARNWFGCYGYGVPVE